MEHVVKKVSLSECFLQFVLRDSEQRETPIIIYARHRALYMHAKAFAGRRRCFPLLLVAKIVIGRMLLLRVLSQYDYAFVP